MSKKASLHIDLNERFDVESDDEEQQEKDHPFLKLAGDYGFINIKGEVKDDNWFYYKNKKVIDMTEVYKYASVKREKYDPEEHDDFNSEKEDFDYVWIFIADKVPGNDKICEIEWDKTPVYYRGIPVVIDEIAMIDGHFCWSIYG